MTQLLPPKKEVALALLERSNVDVYLDPRANGVVVPPQFRREPRLILKIGLNMPVPIPDLRLDDESMSCTLSFSRSPFFCVVPWDSVFAMVGDDGRGMVWPDDVPQELAVRVVEDRRPSSEREPAPATPRGRGRAKGASGEAPDGPRAVPSPEGASKGDIPADRPSRSKKPRKKKDERPVLVAVPAAQERREARAEGRSDKAAKADKSDAAGPTPRPQAPPAAAPRAPGRPKRELPPYLRVVK